MRPNQSTEATESRFLGAISTSSIRKLLPRSISKHKSNSSNPKLSNSNAENTPPADPNVPTTDIQVSHSVTQLSPSKLSVSGYQITSEAPAPPDLPVQVEFLKSHLFFSTKGYIFKKYIYKLKKKNVQDEIVASDSQCEVLAPPEPPVKVWDSHEISIFFLNFNFTVGNDIDII
jgi:hypothetical protein